VRVDPNNKTDRQKGKKDKVFLNSLFIEGESKYFLFFVVLVDLSNNKHQGKTNMLNRIELYKSKSIESI
jgi:hypothetical protein